MSYTKGLCTPAMIYILFSVTQIMIDMFKGLFNTAFIKFCISFLITLLLHYLCASGYKVISWIIVFIPFILMTVITYILLLSLGMDPYKGRLSVVDPNQKISINTDIRKQYSDLYGNAADAIQRSIDNNTPTTQPSPSDNVSPSIPTTQPSVTPSPSSQIETTAPLSSGPADVNAIGTT